MRRGDDPDYVGDEGDKLWLGARHQMKFKSAHTYPAYNRAGNMIFIKTVPLHLKDSQEYDVWRMLDSPEARLHPDNHTVPVREVLFFNPDFSLAGFKSEPADARVFVVMDRFDTVTTLDDASISDPGYPFINTIEDLYQFFLQIAQAVRFMHDLGVAHQDIMDKNFLIDRARTTDRCYVIDFQFSLYFSKPWITPPRVLIDADHAPEAFRPKKPYDPFPADVYAVGTVFHHMIRAYQALVGLRSLKLITSLSLCAKTLRNSDLRFMMWRTIFKN